MKILKEEYKFEQAEVEEEEAMETSPLVRKSRNGDDNKIFEISAVDGEGSNGVSVSNGHAISENEDLIIPAAEEDEKMESDWARENESEAINGEENSENLVFHDKVEGLGVLSSPTYTCKTLILEGPLHRKYDVSSLDPAIQFNGTSSVVNNQQHTGEIEENNISGSKVQPSNSSSLEDVNSPTTYFTPATILKGPVKYDILSLDPSTQNGISSSSVQPLGSSSQEGTSNEDCLQITKLSNSTFTCNLKEPSLEGLVKYDATSLGIHVNGTSVIKNQYEEEIEEDGISSSNVAEMGVVNEDDLEITESDVERVIQNQITHDLFCPNCKSCITKRVILSKRKRGIRIRDEEVKRPKTGTAVNHPNLGTVSLEDQVHEEGEVGNDDAQIPTIDEDDRERGPYIFRCLSCFSIFMPTGDGFKLFRNFGDRSGKENVRDEQAPNVKRNWFSNIFKPNKQETAVDAGSSSLTSVQQVSSAVSSSESARESDNASEELKETTEKTTTHEGRDRTLSFSEGYYLKLPLIDKMEIIPSQEVDISQDSILPATLPMSVPSADSTVTASDVDGKLSISIVIPHEEQDVKATIVNTSSIENRNVDSRSSENGEPYSAEVAQQMTTTTMIDFSHDKPFITEVTTLIGDAPLPQGAGNNEARITIDTHPAPSSHIDTVSQPETQIRDDGERSEARGERKIEVIKSVVYGGLAESITSLSIVSSAAGGGVPTLNVLALGAANLIGGLFIIAHNLWDLRCDRVEEQHSNQITEHGDRYKQLLGKRQNFALHAVVAIISYMVFGLVPPVLYGFSFQESDDKQLKLVVVAAAALVCILALALGKAYVQRPPKPYLKTVMTFLILGILVSGMSYAAGGLVERLLDKLGLFESHLSAAPDLLMQEMRSVGSGWASA